MIMELECPDKYSSYTHTRISTNLQYESAVKHGGGSTSQVH